VRFMALRFFVLNQQPDTQKINLWEPADQRLANNLMHLIQIATPQIPAMAGTLTKVPKPAPPGFGHAGHFAAKRIAHGCANGR